MIAPCDALILSDFHLGHSSARPRVVRRFLDGLTAPGVTARPGRVVVAGDALHDLDFRRWKPSHWEALAALRRLAAACPVVWVTGNHDGCAGELAHLVGPGLRVEPAWDFASGGRRVYVRHGHDEVAIGRRPECGGASGVSDAEARAALAGAWTYPTDKALRQAVAAARGAVWYARENHFDAAVCGHTHAPFCGTLAGVAYANTGSWTDGRASYVCVRDGTLSLHHFEAP